MYACTVAAEGCVNTGNASYYNFDPKGCGITTVSVTAVLKLDVLTTSLLPPLPPSSSSQLPTPPSGVTATRNGYDYANVSWVAPSIGTPPAGYEVVFYQLTGRGR